MSLADIADQAIEVRRRIDPYIRTTPLERLTGTEGGPVAYVKCEHLQVTGSFKARGALSKLTGLTDDERTAGVTTASTGNHGAAVAYGAHHLGLDAVVFVPDSAPEAKLANIRRWGADIKPVGGDPVESERMARSLAVEAGRSYISPYNDEAVVAGQATIGVELIDQLEELDTVIVSVGGGGLISGVGAVVRMRWPEALIVGCSAANSNVMMQSVAAGQILDLPSLPTLSDGTAGSLEDDTLTFDLCREVVDEWVEVGEDEIAGALIDYVKGHHQIIEGSAAMAIAARQQLIDRRIELGTTVVVSCGANIDSEQLAKLLRSSN